MAEAPRTAFATAGLRVGAMLMMEMKDVRLGTATPKIIKVMDPEQSTQGGRQARQPIAFVPQTGEGPTVTAGWMDVAQQASGFLTYEDLKSKFEARWGMQLDFDKNHYLSAVGQMVQFLQSQGVNAEIPKSTTMASPAAAPQHKAPTQHNTSSGAGMSIGMLIVGILIGLGIGYVVFGG